MLSTCIECVNELLNILFYSCSVPVICGVDRGGKLGSTSANDVLGLASKGLVGMYTVVMEGSEQLFFVHSRLDALDALDWVADATSPKHGAYLRSHIIFHGLMNATNRS